MSCEPVSTCDTLFILKLLLLINMILPTFQRKGMALHAVKWTTADLWKKHEDGVGGFFELTRSCLLYTLHLHMIPPYRVEF